MCTFSRVVQYQYWIIRCEVLMLCYLPVYPWKSNFLDRPFQRVCECLERLVVGITCLCLEGPNRDLHGACPVRCLPIWECDKMRQSCAVASHKSRWYICNYSGCQYSHLAVRYCIYLVLGKLDCPITPPAKVREPSGARVSASVLCP